MEMTDDLNDLLEEMLNHPNNKEFEGSKWDLLKILSYDMSSDDDRQYDISDFARLTPSLSIASLLHGTMYNTLEDDKPDDFIQFSQMSCPIDYHWQGDSFLDYVLRYHEDSKILNHMIDNGFTLNTICIEIIEKYPKNSLSDNYKKLNVMALEYKLENSLEHKSENRKIKL